MEGGSGPRLTRRGPSTTQPSLPPTNPDGGRRRPPRRSPRRSGRRRTDRRGRDRCCGGWHRRWGRIAFPVLKAPVFVHSYTGLRGAGGGGDVAGRSTTGPTDHRPAGPERPPLLAGLAAWTPGGDGVLRLALPPGVSARGAHAERRRALAATGSAPRTRGGQRQPARHAGEHARGRSRVGPDPRPVALAAWKPRPARRGVEGIPHFRATSEGRHQSHRGAVSHRPPWR